jgi:hypothetical protein
VDSIEAKRILRAYQPGMESDADPRIAEALELTKRDPILAAWFEEQSALNSTLTAKFAEVPVPGDLKERILAERKIVRPTLWWRSRTALAAAAALVLLVAVTAMFFRSMAGSDLHAYRKDMVQFVADLYKMNARATTWDGLRQSLAKQGWPSDFIVPDALRSVRLEGGCMHYWREEKVSLACMKTAENKGLWLFVIPRASLQSAPALPAPQFATVGKLSTATWTSGDKTYLLASEADIEALKKYL